jgi:hypothetical protein
VASFKKLATQSVHVVRKGGRKAAAPGFLWTLIIGYLALVFVGFFLGNGIEKFLVPAFGIGGAGLMKFFSSPSKENAKERFFK